MSHQLFLRRVMGSLRAADAASEELLAGLPEGVDLKAAITIPRKAWKHRKFFALCAVVQPHQSTYPTIDTFRKALTCALGFSDTFKLPDGRTILMPQSIAFDKMDDAEFDALFDRAVQFICERIIPAANSRDLEREVGEIMAGRRGQAA
jgi:hypothetical protein